MSNSIACIGLVQTGVAAWLPGYMYPEKLDGPNQMSRNSTLADIKPRHIPGEMMSNAPDSGDMLFATHVPLLCTNATANAWHASKAES